jgi:hypothetical protein
VFETLQRGETITVAERQAEEDAQKAKERAAAVAKRRMQARENYGIRGDQWGHTFDAFRFAGSPEAQNTQAAALRAARAFAEQFPNVERGLMFVGDPGVGKDFFLDCIVTALDQRMDPPKMFKDYSLNLEKRFLDQWFGDKNRDENGDYRDELFGKERPSDLEVFLRSRELLLIGDLHKILGVRSQSIVAAITRVIKDASDIGKPRLCISSMIPIRNGQPDANGTRMDYETLFGAAIASWLEGCMDEIVVTGPDRRRRAA